MQLTLQTDYAFRTLLYVGARPGEVVPASAVAKAYGISGHHVAKVAKALTGLGWLRAERGKGGGVRLAVAPASVRVGDVVRAFEPGTDLLPCFDPAHRGCPIASACRLRGALMRARDAFLGELDRCTLADLLANGPALALLLTKAPAARPGRPPAAGRRPDGGTGPARRPAASAPGAPAARAQRPP